MANSAFISCRLSKFAFTGFLLAALANGALARRQSVDVEAPSATVTVAELPASGKETYQTILRGGPFPYEKDGSIFGNRERILPRARRGHYLEYTVKSPGSHDRGAQRIVCGGSVPAAPDACWYSDDHYSSFKRIVP